MNVYIEVLIATNMSINLFIMILSLTTMRISLCWWRLLLSATLGTAFAVALPFMQFKGIFALKILLGIAMILIMARYKTKAKFLGSSALFFGYTFLLGGLVQGIFNIQSSSLGLMLPSGMLPLYLSFGALLLLILSRIVVCKLILVKRDIKNEYKITLSAHSKTVSCNAYYDSGNKLYYRGNRPIIIVDKKLISELYSDDILKKNKKSIEVDTIIGNKKLQVVEIDSLKFCDGEKKTIFSAMCAISDISLKPYSALLHCDI